MVEVNLRIDEILGTENADKDEFLDTLEQFEQGGDR